MSVCDNACRLSIEAETAPRRSILENMLIDDFHRELTDAHSKPLFAAHEIRATVRVTERHIDARLRPLEID